MIVWRDRETGPAYPSIGSAPSIGTFGMSLSVTTFMTILSSRFNGVQGIRNPRLHHASVSRRRNFSCPRGDRSNAPIVAAYQVEPARSAGIDPPHIDAHMAAAMLP